MARNGKGRALRRWKSAMRRPPRRMLKHCLLDDCSGSVGTDVTANRAGTQGLLALWCRLRPGQPSGRTGRECRHNTFSLPRRAGAATKFGEAGGKTGCEGRLKTGRNRGARALLAKRFAVLQRARMWTHMRRRFGLRAQAKNGCAERILLVQRTGAAHCFADRYDANLRRKNFFCGLQICENRFAWRAAILLSNSCC